MSQRARSVGVSLRYLDLRHGKGVLGQEERIVSRRRPVTKNNGVRLLGPCFRDVPNGFPGGIPRLVYLGALTLPFHLFIQQYLKSAMRCHLVLFTLGCGPIVEGVFEGVAFRWYHDGVRGLTAV